MKRITFKKAFTLIEASVVILVIGILIAGITQGSRFIKDSRLKTAASLTQSSPVASIQDLTLWLESTSEKSFDDADSTNGHSVTNWYDINPRSLSLANFTQATAANRPTYTDGVLNSLPAIKFTNTGSAVTSSFMSTTGFANINSNATVFLVAKTPATLVTQAIISKRVAAADLGTNIQVNVTTATDGWQFCASVTSSGTQHCYTGGSGITTNKGYVVSMVYFSSSSSGIKFYQNGGDALDSADSTPDSVSTSSAMSTTTYLGKNGLTAAAPSFFFNGYLAELIIFDRALKKEERESVQNYLGKKWGITIAASGGVGMPLPPGP